MESILIIHIYKLRGFFGRPMEYFAKYDLLYNQKLKVIIIIFLL